METYYPQGLTLALEQASGKKPVYGSALLVTLAPRNVLEDGEQTPVDDLGDISIGESSQFVAPSPSRTPPIRGSKARGRGGRVRGVVVVKAKPGILQTPGRKMHDFFSGMEPKPLKAKEKGKKRGRGAWKGKGRNAGGPVPDDARSQLVLSLDQNETREEPPTGGEQGAEKEPGAGESSSDSDSGMEEEEEEGAGEEEGDPYEEEL